MKKQHVLVIVWALHACCLIWWAGYFTTTKDTPSRSISASASTPAPTPAPTRPTLVPTSIPDSGVITPLPHCDYTEGVWEGNLSWVPTVSQGCTYKVFTQAEAFECLENKLVVLVGNSNTRALYSALEGILKNKTITPRLEAKQTCENNQKNHSCGMEVTLEGHGGSVQMYYWGYVGGMYGNNLNDFFRFQRHADVVVMNAGLNMIQAHKESTWTASTKSDAPKLNKFVADTLPHSKAFWMTTTRICEAQPHFKKYTYKKSYWKQRSLTQINAEIARHNTMAASLLVPPVAVVDAAHMAAPPALCPHYDDPLHHKAVDTHVANVLLNMYCTSN